MAEILAHLECLLQARTLDIFNLLVEGDFVVVISWVSKLERGPWKYFW